MMIKIHVSLCLFVYCFLFPSLLDYIIEREPIVNKFISVPKDKKFINCAAFIGGIIEAILNECSFVSKKIFEYLTSTHLSSASKSYRTLARGHYVHD